VRQVPAVGRGCGLLPRSLSQIPAGWGDVVARDPRTGCSQALQRMHRHISVDFDASAREAA